MLEFARTYSSCVLFWILLYGLVLPCLQPHEFQRCHSVFTVTVFVTSAYSICHVSVVGWPLSDFRARLSGDQRKFFLEYIGQFKANEAGGDGANKLLVPEGETPTGTWMSFAERIRQLRATRVLRPNRLFLNTLLGNITVASLLLAQEDQEDSSDDEVDMEDIEGDGDEEEEDSSL